MSGERNLSAKRQKFELMQSTFSHALPRMVEVLGNPAAVARFTRIALAQVGPNSKLLECTTPSILGCLFECATLDLEPSVAGQCWMVPFRKKRVPTATLIVGYKGHIQLGWRTDQIASIVSGVIFEKDEWTYSEGWGDNLEPKLTIDRCDLRGEMKPGKIVAAYCVSKTIHGGTMISLLSERQIAARRAKAHEPTRTDSTWKTHTEAMYRKSAVRDAATLWPQNVNSGRALDIDDAALQGRQSLEVDPKDFGFGEAGWEDADAKVEEARDVTPGAKCGKPCGDTRAEEPQSCGLEAGHEGTRCVPEGTQ